MIISISKLYSYVANCETNVNERMWKILAAILQDTPSIISDSTHHASRKIKFSGIGIQTNSDKSKVLLLKTTEITRGNKIFVFNIINSNSPLEIRTDLSITDLFNKCIKIHTKNINQEDLELFLSL